jgi:hypothetical protein
VETTKPARSKITRINDRRSMIFGQELIRS